MMVMVVMMLRVMVGLVVMMMLSLRHYRLSGLLIHFDESEGEEEGEEDGDEADSTNPGF